MRHRNSGRRFDRDTSSRRAMFRNLAANLILHERIETTDAKAKELRRIAERLITSARRLGTVAYTPQAELSPSDRARRLAASRRIAAYVPRFGVRIEAGGVPGRVDLVEKVMIDLARRYASRQGGYTRIVKFGPRRGDNAPVSRIELVESGEPPHRKPKAAAPSAAATPAGKEPAPAVNEAPSGGSGGPAPATGEAPGGDGE